MRSTTLALVVAILASVLSTALPSRPAMAEDLFEELPMIRTTIRNGEEIADMWIRCENEVPNQATTRAVAEQRGEIIDGFIAHIDTLRVTDLQGSDNLHRLRTRFRGIAGAVIAPLRVEAVLFKEMLVSSR
jgi:flagellar FliL protein